MKKAATLTITVLLFFAAHAQQTPKFTATVSSDSILLGNYFEVQFELKDGKGKNFQTPSFTAFDVVGGPNQSSSMRIINGEVTQSMSFTFYLEPKETGNFYIEPASIEVDGKVLETQPLQVIVVPNPDGVIQRPQGQEREGDWMQPFWENERPREPEPPKKKRKTYRL
jgi:hypothetical protein